MWDYKINLKSGKELPSEKLRFYNFKNLLILEEYMKEAVKKGWIRKSKSLAAANMLLAGKKGEFKRRLYVNYCGLNNATIRDIYPLSNAQFL